MHIFALGGGDLSVGATQGIDEAIVGATGKSNPKALFVPTAGDDDPEYCQSFLRMYGSKLGCEVDFLRLWGTDTEPSRIREKVASADLIYVGGGNSRRMLAKWRESGVDSMLAEAGRNGAVLGGLSAGANCWFRYCNSDWPMMEGSTERLTARLDCLGFFPLTFCPHMRDEEFRIREFRAMMRDTPGVGIGVDDCAALELDGRSYRVVACEPGSRAHRIFWRDETLVHEEILPTAELRPLSDLLDLDRGVGASLL